jgi:hypothetical protein
MTNKAKLAIVALIMIATLLMAGCINIISPSPTPSVPTPIPTTTHNSILESAANELMSANPLGWEHYAKKVTWNGGNSVTIFFIERAAGNYSATPLAANKTIMVFASTQDATKYIDSIDKSQYIWDDKPYSNDSAIPVAISSLGVPSAYQHWYYIQGSEPTEKFGAIYQFDNIVQLDTDWELG